MAALIRERLSSTNHRFNVRKDRRYVIDLVATWRSDNPLGASEELHLIEAKNSPGNLPLDRVAKAFCAAMRYRPASLTLAVHDGIQPQAMEYARVLFPPRQQQPVINVLRVARGLTPGGHLERIEGDASTDSVQEPLFSVERWELWKDATFTSEMITNIEQPFHTIELSPDSPVVLRLFCTLADAFPIESYSARMDSRFFREQSRFQLDDQVRFDLALIPWEEPHELEHLEFELSRGSRADSHYLPLPPLSFSDPHSILPPLRDSLTQDWSRMLEAANGNPSVPM
ncbi:MAG: hypothetical protein ACPG4N_01860 [Gammaproteobacteria bacterium]